MSQKDLPMCHLYALCPLWRPNSVSPSCTNGVGRGSLCSVGPQRNVTYRTVPQTNEFTVYQTGGTQLHGWADGEEDLTAAPIDALAAQSMSHILD